MSIYIHKSSNRGSSDHGWLKSRFSFSFADYFDRSRMNFGVLRVLNDDTIAPDSGFPMHPHKDMEIITIVTEGQLQHKDSLGNGSMILPGEVQRMSAGSGIIHSEWNPSKDETLKLYQIWILTKEQGVEPSYDQSVYEIIKGRLTTLASGEGGGGLLTIHQDAWIHRGAFGSGSTLDYKVNKHGNGIFIFLIAGSIDADGKHAEAGDSIEVTEADSLSIRFTSDSDFILFEVPMER